MTTALQIITGAARLIGVVRKGEALAADESSDALVSLNDMISSWSNHGLLVYARVWESFNISAAASYSIGAAQTLNTVKPISIKAAFIRSGNTDYPMEFLTDEQYEAIQDKSTTSPFPDNFNYDNGHPYGTLRFYPQLGTSAELHLLSEKVLTNFAALSTTVDLPAGWNKALRYNLAIEMAPEFGVQIEPAVAKGASDSLSAISLAIAKNRPIKYSPSPVKSGDIYTGWYR